MTREDWHAFHTSETCHVCDKPLEGYSVRDHCHITGKYQGAAHNPCNRKLRLNPKTTTILVVFHNLWGYDSHLLLQAVSKVEGKISCVPNNTEKYVSFSLGQLRFIDSTQFLLASLDKLVERTRQRLSSPTQAQQRKTGPNEEGCVPLRVHGHLGLLHWAKTPPKEVFYSKLSDVHISDEDYAHVQKVWETFGCKTLGDYSDLYCRTHVLLLADVFETFRRTCQKQYSLDPAQYYTSPGLTWDALLKKTGVELELLTDYDQHLFIEKGLRGGISMASKRHARANNPLVEGYDPGQPSSHILYLDANNLYSWAMSQYLPTGGFRWVDDCQQLAKTIAEQPADSPKGYIFEVDLEYPEDLHDAHNSYPLAPERMVVQKEWMLKYQHNLLGVGVAPTEVEELVPNLRNKDCYVLHYRNLQLYMSLGMRLTKVHPALRFDQSPWMEPYIQMNTELRKKAASGFEKDLYKLMNNSVFGKTMENLQRRVDVKLVRSNEEDKLGRLIASPAFARANIFDDDLAAIQVHKSRLELNRLVFVGMNILDLSKHLMYDFYSTSSRGSTGIVVSSSTPTASSPRMSSETWPPTQSSMTPQTTHRSTHCTASPTKRCWGRWRTSVQGAPFPNISVCALRCTQSLRPVGETSRRQRVWKRMSWKSTSDMSSTKRLSSESEPSATAWTSCGQSAITSTGSVWPLSCKLWSDKISYWHIRWPSRSLTSSRHYFWWTYFTRPQKLLCVIWKWKCHGILFSEADIQLFSVNLNRLSPVLIRNA